MALPSVCFSGLRSTVANKCNLYNSVQFRGFFHNASFNLTAPERAVGGGGGGGGGNQHRNAVGQMAGGGGPRGSGNQNARVYVGNLAWDVAWQVREHS